MDVGRHHAVFFPPGYVLTSIYHALSLICCSREHDNNNCPPGLVVDSAITNPAVPNFYLQSHAAIQGSESFLFFFVLRIYVDET